MSWSKNSPSLARYTQEIKSNLESIHKSNITPNNLRHQNVTWIDIGRLFFIQLESFNSFYVYSFKLFLKNFSAPKSPMSKEFVVCQFVFVRFVIMEYTSTNFRHSIAILFWNKVWPTSIMLKIFGRSVTRYPHLFMFETNIIQKNSPWCIWCA